VIRHACSASSIETPELTYTCSVVLARTMLDLPSYSLPYCANEIGFPLGDHHNPSVDAEAAAQLVIELARRADAKTLDELLTSQRVRWGTLGPDGWTGSTKRESVKVLPEVNPDADSKHFLYGQRVVLTGALPSGMVRSQAWDAVAALGGIPQKGVTSTTTLLVLAELDPTRLKPGSDTSTKHREALALRQAGHQIEIMAGQDFLALLD